MRRRTRWGLLAALAVVLIAGCGGGGEREIATGAARLVPSDALVYVHLSTDPERAAVRDATALAERFPSYGRLRASVLRSLAVGGDEAAIRPWLGDEAALALLASSSGTAGSLVLLALADREKAEAFVERGARRSGPAQTYRGVTFRRYGAVLAALVGDHLVLGQADSLRKAVDLAQGRGAALAADATYRRLAERLAPDRVADAYATADGLRRLLAPAGGLLGAAGTLLDRPSLKATAVSLAAQDAGARIVVHSTGRSGPRPGAFEPQLLERVPKGALAYVATRSLDRTAARLLRLGGASGIGDLLARSRDVVDLLKGETAVVVLPGLPAPTLLVLAEAPDAARARRAVEAVRKLRIGQVRLHGDLIGGTLVLSTTEEGMAAARDPQGGIGKAEAFRQVTSSEGPATSIVFLDFSQLLRLGEQTGLNDSRAYLAVKGDLGKVQAIGARSTGTGDDTTSEIRLLIP